jgi:membrane protein required for colicin V production
LAVADYVIVGIVAISALIGLTRGFVREVLSLAIWGVAVILAVGFAGDIAASLPKRLEGDSLRYVAAFTLVFVGALVIGALAQWIVSRLVQTTGLSGTDRLLGLLFGGLRGAVVCIVAVIALRPFANEQPWWRASHGIPMLSAFESDVMHVFSSAGEMVNRLREKR